MFNVRRALVSVSDKRDLIPFATGLAELDIEILSTGGTARTLRDAGIDVVDVSAKTGFPEIMDGRVKTLHPTIHGGLLGRRGTDEAVMAEHGIEPIDLLVVNLYPFEQTIARADATIDDAIDLNNSDGEEGYIVTINRKSMHNINLRMRGYRQI